MSGVVLLFLFVFKYIAVAMPVEIGARGFVGSSVYDLLTEVSIWLWQQNNKSCKVTG